ncbi:MAG: ABC transporter ATP-binding protein [Actinomycetota bacterium]|jgi:oligopeptide transport system ATP-binding protein|nr:ABC transporter ATP-binding protein [Actinomycetota bacterium]
MPLLEVRDLQVRFSTRGKTVYAVNGISFDLDPGDTLGIVGESGCGKSVSALAMLGILPKPAGRVSGGQVVFEGEDLLTLPDDRLRHIRGNDIAMVFQDPMTSLNPVLTVGRQLTEALRTHLDMDKKEATGEAGSLLERVGIPDARQRLRDYPHQFSGGMRQRVGIAMAIACRPKVLIADEPTTALDVTIQAQILELLRTLVREEDMALILVTHDLGVVAGVCARTHVMYAGRFVETAPTTELFANPKHPYTVGLLKSVPRLDAARKQRLDPIAGAPRDQTSEPTACAFAPRCTYATSESWEQLPVLRELDGANGAAAHRVACWNPVPDQDLVAAGIRQAPAGQQTGDEPGQERQA